MNWNIETLGNLLEQSGSDRAGKRGYPVLSITMKQGLVDQADKFKKRVASQDTSNYRVVYKDELVVGFPIDEGVLGFQVKYPAGIVSPAYDIWKLKDKSNTHIPYLERYLRSPQARSIYASKMQGAVARRRSLTKIDFLNLGIPFPPFEDQLRIAHLLGKAEGLIAQRKQHLQQLDDLLKSVFLEMFGFRNGTYTQWTIERLALQTEVVSGVTKGKKYTDEELIEVPYMRVANVQDGHFVLDEVKTIAVTQKETDKYQLRQGDLLLTEGGDPDKLGRGSVWEEQIPNCIHQNHIFRVRINEQAEINPYYLSALVGSRYGKAYFLKSAKQTTGIASINSTQLKNFPTVLPPIDLQSHFAAIVEKVEGIKSQYQQSLAELENLYGALSQKAFKGELDLSRVPLQPITANLNIQEEDDTLVATATVTEQQQAVDLPDVEDMLAAIVTTQGRERILKQWLEAYAAQLKGSTFSVNDFLGTAQVRLAELHPENEFEIGVPEYDALKKWVFAALGNGRLAQVYDDTRNRVQVVAAKG